MTKWKLLTKIIKDKQTELDQQIDDVGNIYQKSGAVVPKACQKCKKPFDAKVKSVPLKQNVPFYSCDDCSFKTGDPTEAFDHKVVLEHKISRKAKYRIIRWDNTLDGQKANIKEVFDDDDLVDIEILCDNCHYS